ncbi:Lrp/AsnC family transcriptional regulator [Microbulbifer litoralis]|uniref:Lrp/AsnC family transcriptional regulator n=1 Tax=Microbulbifer litoralis TaxID=2933965 RepID=UPI00202899E9
MDSFDTEILKILQTSSRISTEELGVRVGLSASACQRRIKRLKAEGIVSNEVAILDREKLPGFITVIIDVTLEKGGEKALDKFIAQLNEESRVQQFYYVAGEVDFVVIVVTKSMDDFDNLCRQVLMSNANVKKFSSKVVIKSEKVGMAVPL